MDSDYVNLGPELPDTKNYTHAKALLQSIYSARGTENSSELGIQNHGHDPINRSLYDHMVKLLKHILEVQPQYALDQFEQLSYQVKRETGTGLIEEDVQCRAPDVDDTSKNYTHAKNERSLFKHPKHKWDEPPFSTEPLPNIWGGTYDDETELARLDNLSSILFLIEQSGIGLNSMEIMRIWLSIRKLSLELQSIVKLRFWGKIMGLKNSYYIVEGDFEPGTEPDNSVPAPFNDWRPFPKSEVKQEDLVKKQDSESTETIEITDSRTDLQKWFDEARLRFEKDLPQSNWRPLWPVLPEDRGHGLNRWDYFACTSLSSTSEWFRLPPVRPEHIQFARLSRQFLSGNPMANVLDGPGLIGPFPGVEAHLLRAQIARITSACWVCPVGIYEVNDDEELEEGELPETLNEVEDIEPMDLNDLLNLSNWQHFRPYALPQGRYKFFTSRQFNEEFLNKIINNPKHTGWFDPMNIEKWKNYFVQKNAKSNKINDATTKDQEEEEEEDENEDEDDETGDDYLNQIQEGPALLGPINEDDNFIPIGYVGLPKRGTEIPKGLPMWRVKTSTVVFPQNCAIACVSNARWPGAYALAKNIDFLNIYIGWGLKSLGTSFSPSKLLNPLNEFVESEEQLKTNTNEIVDPTPLEEEALREAKEARRLAKEMKAEEQEEGEEEEEEEEED